MKKIAWAVVCKDEEFSTKREAKLYKRTMDRICVCEGPHLIVKLVEERQKVSSTKQEGK